MKAHISIRSIGWGFKYGIWLGKRRERERIIKLLDTTRMCTCNSNCKTDINVVAFVLEELRLNLMDLIRGKI